MTMRLWLVPALLLSTTLCHGEIVVQDHSGRTLRLDRPATRIVSLAPHITEMLYAVGAGERIVATVDASDYPSAARSIPRLGSHAGIDLEALLNTRPDLVIAWKNGTPPKLIETMRALGLPLFVSQTDHVDSLAEELERYGKLTGNRATGEKAAHQFRLRLADLEAHYAPKPPVRVFYQIWDRPLMTVGGTQLLSEVIRLCGGENVFGQVQALVPTVSVEAVLAARPEAIIVAAPENTQAQWLSAWKPWARLPAVAQGNLYHIHPDLMHRPSPRLLDGAEQLCQQLDEARARRK